MTPPEAPRRGTLYLIPVPIDQSGNPLRDLPSSTIEVAARLSHFVVEQARTARGFLRQLPLQRPLQELSLKELDQRTPAPDLSALLAPLRQGEDLGLMSESGCPAVADPGARLVALAHEEGFRVVPLTGPSSLLLALMACGMNGQAFSFTGYVPVDPQERLRSLQSLEQRSARLGETVLMIETPYRNQALFEALLASLSPSTRLSIASEITAPGERIRTRSIAQWKALLARQDAETSLPRAPTVFAMMATGTARPSGSGAPARTTGAPGPGTQRRRQPDRKPSKT